MTSYPTAVSAVPPTLPAQGAPPPAQAVQEAAAVLARFRKIMLRTGGGLGLVFVGASMATEPITWCLSLLGLGTVALAYRFPLTGRVRRARAVMREWESGGELPAPRVGSPAADPGAAAADPRLAAADTVIARLAEHAADPRAVAFGQEVRQQLVRVLGDARAVEQLRGALSPAEAEARLGALRAQVDERIDRLMAALTEVYQAVLAHDDATLGAVLERGEDVLRQLSARQEVERLLGS